MIHPFALPFDSRLNPMIVNCGNNGTVYIQNQAGAGLL